MLTRILNFPELLGKDRWVYNSQKINDCYICNKSKYTVIFYERGRSNVGLTKIGDKDSQT